MRSGEYPSDWPEISKSVKRRDDYTCQNCGKRDTRTWKLEAHHVIPISQGGSHRMSNLTTLCSWCHGGEHLPRYYLEKAMNEKKWVIIKYQSKGSNKATTYKIAPYGIEMYNGAQYLVCFHKDWDKILTLRLNRIEWVSVQNEYFQYPYDGFDAKRYLNIRFGSEGYGEPTVESAIPTAWHPKPIVSYKKPPVKYTQEIDDYPRTKRKGWFSRHCFIATAAYGTPFASDIDVLREWRDYTLRRSVMGRWFVYVYYRISPPIAEMVSRSRVLRCIVRKGLEPVIGMIRVDSSGTSDVSGGSSENKRRGVIS